METEEILAVRIYLKFVKIEDYLEIGQVSKNIEGTVFLERTRIVEQPENEKKMKTALQGTIQTTINYCRMYNGERVTHIGIYLSDVFAMDILKKQSMPNYLKNGIKLIIVQKEFQ